MGVFVAWTVPLIVLVVPVNRLLFRAADPARATTSRREDIDVARSVGRYVSVDFVASMLRRRDERPDAAARPGEHRRPTRARTCTSPWTIAYTVHFLSENVGMSMITEGSRDPEHLIDYARQTLVHSLRIVVPLRGW